MENVQGQYAVRVTGCVMAFFLWVADCADATLNIGLGTGGDYTFVNGGLFDVNNSAGNTIGPFTDTASGLSGSISNIAINPSSGLGSQLNETSPGLGINNLNTSADAASEFDGGESWAFTWDVVRYQFVGVDLGAYTGDGSTATTGQEDRQFFIQSGVWIGLVFTPGTGVAFNSSTGRFTFDADVVNDKFTSAALWGNLGYVPTNDPGTSITFGYSGTSGSTPSAFIQEMSYNLLVPEPSTGVLFGLAVLSIWRRRRAA